MEPYQKPENRLLEGRELPKELLDRFDSWGISRQERDTFRDRLWRTGPTKSEIDTVAAAENPWAELGKLEGRPRPRRRDQFDPGPRIIPLENKEGERSPSRPRTQSSMTNPSSLAEGSLPKPEINNPYASRLREMSDVDLFEFYDNFIRLYHLDSPYAVPEAMLQDSKLLIYQALTAEVRYRKRGE